MWLVYIVRGYFFENQTFAVRSNSSSDTRNETIYVTTLPNKAVVTIYISTFNEDTNVIFANHTIPVCILSKFNNIIMILTQNWFRFQRTELNMPWQYLIKMSFLFYNIINKY